MSSAQKEVKESSKEGTQVLDLNDVEIVVEANGSPKNAVKSELHVTNETQKTHKRQLSRDFGQLPGELDGDKVQASQPLLEPDRGRQKPPLAGPEIDDLDGDDEKPAPTGNGHYPGIDDGLLDPPAKPDHDPEDGDGEKQPEDGSGSQNGDTGGYDDGNSWQHDEPDHPLYGTGLDPKYGFDSRPGSPMMPGSIPDVNTYQQKKNLAQGMMDLALLSANANQLRYVLESASSHPYYYPSLTFISLSIALQIAVGVGLIMNSRYNVKDDKDICKADKINNMTILGIFLITIVNVFITSFSVAAPTVPVGTDVQNVG